MSQNHPFIDGNRRVAFACMHVFLKINGGMLQVTSEEVEDFIEKLFEAYNFEYKELESWLRDIVIIS
ncbi:MAG: type II toxin-antitoxin system death-on-curing family toxin [Candidatus Caenarcaniphilales bacterium]|nr:type II toxin-antitoxin system death-on-curing family toxin [Candidatus Caenarcaniphilales bacterium]